MTTKQEIITKREYIDNFSHSLNRLDLYYGGLYAKSLTINLDRLNLYYNDMYIYNTVTIEGKNE